MHAFFRLRNDRASCILPVLQLTCKSAFKIISVEGTRIIQHDTSVYWAPGFVIKGIFIVGRSRNETLRGIFTSTL